MTTRGELLKRLFASHRRQDEFRTVAMQIISDEEKKKNTAFARALRRSLESAGGARPSNGSNGDGQGKLHLLPHERDKLAPLVEPVTPVRRRNEIVLSRENLRLLSGVIEEFRRGDTIRRHGLKIRSKLLFCGPPGCGKTLCAEIFANEAGLPLLITRIDVLISSYLGETSGNLRKVFDFASENPSVLLLDEFDSLARSRDDESEHSELKRVVNSLLQLIDRHNGDGFLIAATNYEGRLDPAIWRRFDEVIFFSKPTKSEIQALLTMKMRNFGIAFELKAKVDQLVGFSHAEIERVCINAIKQSILCGRSSVSSTEFDRAYEVEVQRRKVIEHLSMPSV